MGTYSRVNVYSSFMFAYYNEKTGFTAASSNLTRLSMVVEMGNKKPATIGRFLGKKFSEGIMKYEWDTGVVLKIDMANWISGKPRGDKGKSFTRGEP